VPGDRFALAVQVGCEEDVAAGIFGELFEFGDDLAAAGEDFVLGDERLQIDAHALRGEVADVAHAGLYDVVVAEVLIDRLGLGRRLDDDEMFAVLFAHFELRLSRPVVPDGSRSGAEQWCHCHCPILCPRIGYRP